ncbi:hypothetical protein [Pseudothermotoga sp.]|uniref:hypothetical protein n=1 Tax=Pseudothermotoga sp. TaxID=2033661 RepID=UPI0031F62B3D
MVYPVCGTLNSEEERYCKKCGAWLGSNVNPVTPKRSFFRKIPGFRSGKLWKKIIASIFYGIMFLFVIGLIISISTSEQSSKTNTREPPESPEQFKATCEEISYDELARDTERYVGKRVTLTGEVIQVLEKGNNVIMRVNVTKKDAFLFSYWTDTILVEYTRPPNESRILEEDIVQLWGTVKGRITYKAIFGQEVTLPAVDAKYITVVQKRPSQ